MRAITSTILALLIFAAVAGARDAHSPDGAWTMTVPDAWEAAKPEAYENVDRHIHSMFAAPADESKMRPVLQVSVMEEALNVSREAREEFRTQCDAEARSATMPQSGVQPGIERVDVEHIGDRDCYRVEGFLVSKETAPVKFVKWYVPSGDKRFVFSFVASAQTFPARVIEFESIARTIKMRDAAPEKPGAPVDWSRYVMIGGIALAVVCGIAFVFVARRQFRPAASK
ncbi:MAG: hypothetical protein K8T20_15315 [Planctomycetes bacterium]|nr:hypothetical protein [Planctomycetota bacterium]